MARVLGDTPSKVLLNRGVGVLVHQIDSAGQRVLNHEGEPVFQTEFVRFTNTTLAALEDEWEVDLPVAEDVPVRDGNGQQVIGRDGKPEFRTEVMRLADGTPVTRKAYGPEAWDALLQRKPRSAMLRSYALLWGQPIERVAVRLRDDGATDYIAALSLAYAIANGLTGEDQAGKALRSTLRNLEKVAEEIDRAFPDDEDDAVSPSVNGSPRGLALAAP